MPSRSLRPVLATSLLIALLAALWSVGPDDTPAQLQSSAVPLPQCEAAFDPASFETGTVHEEVSVSFTEPVGEVEEIYVEPEAELDILWTHDDREEPTRARVRVSAIRAEPGDWTVTFHGGGVACHGRATVVEDEPTDTTGT